jgi:hypothetical protein
MPEDPDFESHPCEFEGCALTVMYDDEPYCYQHSPDSGSFVAGYSYWRNHDYKK